MTTTTVLWILLVALVGMATYCNSLSLENHRLRKQIADNSGEMFDEGKKLMKQIDDLTTANTKLELLNTQYVAEVILQGRTIEGLEEKLAKFDRHRGEGGKFVRPDGTYTPYDTEEPEMVADAKTEVAEWNEKNIKVTEWDGDFAPNAENTGGISGTYTPPPTGTIED